MSNRAVMVLDRGWIFAGDVDESVEGRYKLSNAVWVFKWSEVGFDGVLAQPLNNPKVTLKKLNHVIDMPARNIELFRIPVDKDWGLTPGSVPELNQNDNLKYTLNRAVVVLDRGWIFAGNVDEDKQKRIKLTDPTWVFKWSDVGFDGVLNDPTNNDKVTLKKLDHVVDIPDNTELFRIPVHDKWGLE